MSAEKVFSIRLVFIDDQKNGVTPLGGAAWETEAEQVKAWAGIHALGTQHESSFQAELLDAADDVIEDKPVSAEICERLMGKSIEQLIAEGRAKTDYTVSDVFKRDPALREKYPALSAAVPY